MLFLLCFVSLPIMVVNSSVMSSTIHTISWVQIYLELLTNPVSCLPYLEQTPNTSIWTNWDNSKITSSHGKPGRGSLTNDWLHWSVLLEIGCNWGCKSLVLLTKFCIMQYTWHPLHGHAGCLFYNCIRLRCVGHRLLLSRFLLIVVILPTSWRYTHHLHLY